MVKRIASSPFLFQVWDTGGKMAATAKIEGKRESDRRLGRLYNEVLEGQSCIKALSVQETERLRWFDLAEGSVAGSFTQSEGVIVVRSGQRQEGLGASQGWSCAKLSKHGSPATIKRLGSL